MRNPSSILLVFISLLVGPVRAATVTNSADIGPGTLREAIANALPGEIIDFAVTSPILLTNGELVIDKDLTILGPGSDTLTIQRSSEPGTPDFRILHIQDGAVMISGLTLSNGRADYGGGVLNASFSVVLMQDITLSGNSATSAGGGLHNEGTLALEDSAFIGNSVQAIDEYGAFGGGLANWGGIQWMDRCLLQGNSVSGGAGDGGGFGGAVHNSGSIGSMDGCILEGNWATGSPGSGYGLGGGLNNDFGTMTLTNCTLINNSATGGTDGGAGWGGGLNNEFGTVYVDVSTVHGNVARGGSGNDGGLAVGGGVANGYGTVEVKRSTISGNSVVGGEGDTGGFGEGGGVANDSGTMYLYNSTVSGNVASGGAGAVSPGLPYGGGIFNYSSLLVDHSTVAYNGIPGSLEDGGGIFNLGLIEIKNTIVAANHATVEFFNADFAETFSAGYNVMGSTSGAIYDGPGDRFEVPAAGLKLGPLQDNGGPTLTHALLCESPALDAGDNTDAPATDQRGFARILGSAIDIGAYEASIYNAPIVSCPGPITLNCAPPSGMVATVSVNVADADGDPLVVVWTVDGTAYQTNLVAAGGPPTEATVDFTKLFGIGIHELTVTVSDSSGCLATCLTSVEVREFAPPTVVSCPSDETIECPAAPVFGTPQFSDACDANLTVTFADESLAVSGDEISKTKRTWRATNAQNKSATCSQTITKADSTAPRVADSPSDATIECPATPVFGTPEFSDACDNSNLTITFADETLPVSGNEVSKIKRTWTATDAHNNSATYLQTITVTDSAAPALVSCPADATIECPATPVFGTPEFGDLCDANLTVTFADETLAVSGNEISKTKRTWTATDAHNNSATCSQTITVLDSAAPTVANCPADMTIECPATPVFGTPEFSDACEANLTVTFADDALAVSGNEVSKIKRTWTAIDAHNNSATCSQTVTVKDATAPAVTCPADSSAPADANCQAVVPNLLAGASDNCTETSAITLSQSPAAGTLVGLGAHTLTVTATDAAGNSASCTTVFTVTGNASLTVTCAAAPDVNADATCQAAVPDLLSGVTVSSGCGTVGTVSLSQSPAAGTLVGAGTHTITVTATDTAGHSATCTTTFVVTASYPAISILTLTDNTNNDLPTGPHIVTGSIVAWTYLVTNPSCEALENITVTDSVTGVIPAYQNGDANLNGQLEPGETWTYAAYGIAGLGQYTNRGTVTGIGTVSSDPVTHSNPDHYFGDPTPCPEGLFAYSIDTASGDLNIKFYQFPAPNDNSYGVNAVGWERGHSFPDLVNSDHAGFQLRDASGVVKLDFYVDYLSPKPGTPSGYGSLGPFGGDGAVVVGTLTSSEITFDTSMAKNLNDLGYFVGGVQTPSSLTGLNGTDLLVNSPPTLDTYRDYTLKTPNPWVNGWDFKNSYFVTIKKAKLDSLGFKAATWMVEADLVGLHNSPAKPCPVGVVGAQFNPATGGENISADAVVTGAFTTLTGPVYTEDTDGQVGLGTIILNAPAGFIFDTGGTPPTVLSAKIAGAANNPVVGSVTSVTSTQIIYMVTAVSINPTRLTWQNIRVRPTSGTPLASGHLTRTGTANVVGLPLNAQLGTLTEIAGVAKTLAVFVQPSATATAGVPFARQPVVQVLDQFGNLRSWANGVADSTVLTAARLAGSGTLQGITTLTAVDGVVNFQNLSHNVATNITIQFTGAGLTPVTSDPIAVGGANVSRLAFTTQPGNGTAGSPFGTQPKVQTQDQFGNNSAAGLPASLPVTVSLSSGTGPLQGTTILDLGTTAGNGTAPFHRFAN